MGQAVRPLPYFEGERTPNRPNATGVFGRPVVVPPPSEYVADGAAKQAAWALLGTKPMWYGGDTSKFTTTATPHVMDRYRTLRDSTVGWKS